MISHTKEETAAIGPGGPAVEAEDRIKTMLHAVGKRQLGLLPQYRLQIPYTRYSSMLVTGVQLTQRNAVTVSGWVDGRGLETRSFYLIRPGGRGEAVAQAVEACLLRCSRSALRGVPACKADARAALQAVEPLRTMTQLRALPEETKGMVYATLESADIRREDGGRWATLAGKLAALSFARP